jgi:hypothetical protein
VAVSPETFALVLHHLCPDHPLLTLGLRDEGVASSSRLRRRDIDMSPELARIAA